jgi:anti-sigma B factor antagonist
VLNIHQQGCAEGYALLRPEGELDAFTVASFRRALAELGGSGGLVIDLSAVAFIDSAGLGALIGGIRRTRELSGQVVVACSRPGLARLLESAGINRHGVRNERVLHRRRSEPRWPRAMRWRPARAQRSVSRGTCRPGY